MIIIPKIFLELHSLFLYIKQYITSAITSFFGGIL